MPTVFLRVSNAPSTWRHRQPALTMTRLGDLIDMGYSLGGIRRIGLVSAGNR